MVPVHTLYGIRNCDTVRKARAWLDERSVPYRFHDYKVEGVERGLLEAWCREVGWETVLNRGGTTFRKLDPALTCDLDLARALALMLAHPSAIKRPVLTGAPKLLVGFKPELYAAELG